MSAVRIEREGDVAVVVIDNPPVNAGSHAVRQGVLEAVAKIDADPAIKGAVLVGAGSTFVAGADIKEFGKPLQDPHLPAVIEAIVSSPKTFVAGALTSSRISKRRSIYPATRPSNAVRYLTTSRTS